MTITLEGTTFTLAYYDSILQLAQQQGYVSQTMRQFWAAGCPTMGSLVLRHDLDDKPLSLKGILEVEQRAGMRSSIFVRVTGNTYNPFDYRVMPVLAQAQSLGHELGLHSNFVEAAMIHGCPPQIALASELQALRAFYGNIRSIACHRDVNYQYNSLPWLEKNWDDVSAGLDLQYQAYDRKIMDNVVYVNETAEQKLGWRTITPERALATGQSVIVSTHPHWWFEKHPFEH
jgi:hypothetical protein